MPLRPICECCKIRPKAVAYHKYGKIYYRRLCDTCIARKKAVPRPVPRWQKAGYKKKPACDQCGFRARHPAAQLLVYHVDGNLNNCETRNLKTLCLNCSAAVTRIDLPWLPGDLEPDR